MGLRRLMLRMSKLTGQTQANNTEIVHNSTVTMTTSTESTILQHASHVSHPIDSISKTAELKTSFGLEQALNSTTSHDGVTFGHDPEWLGAHEVVSMTLVGLFVLITLLVVACYYIYMRCICFKKCRKDKTLPTTISTGNLNSIFVATRGNESKFERASDLNVDQPDPKKH